MPTLKRVCVFEFDMYIDDKHWNIEKNDGNFVL